MAFYTALEASVIRTYPRPKGAEKNWVSTEENPVPRYDGGVGVSQTPTYDWSKIRKSYPPAAQIWEVVLLSLEA